MNQDVIKFCPKPVFENLVKTIETERAALIRVESWLKLFVKWNSDDWSVERRG